MIPASVPALNTCGDRGFTESLSATPDTISNQAAQRVEPVAYVPGTTGVRVTTETKQRIVSMDARVTHCA